MRSTKNFTGSRHFIGVGLNAYRGRIMPAIKAGPGCHRGEHEYEFDHSVKRFRCVHCRVLQPTARMRGEPYRQAFDDPFLIIEEESDSE